MHDVDGGYVHSRVNVDVLEPWNVDALSVCCQISDDILPHHTTYEIWQHWFGSTSVCMTAFSVSSGGHPSKKVLENVVERLF